MNAGNAWTKYTKRRRLAWAGVIIIEILVAAGVTTYLLHRLDPDPYVFVIGGYTAIAFSAFILALGIDPVRVASRPKRIIGWFAASFSAVVFAPVVAAWLRHLF